METACLCSVTSRVPLGRLLQLELESPRGCAHCLGWDASNTRPWGGQTSHATAPRLQRVPVNKTEATLPSVTQAHISIAFLLPYSTSQSNPKPTDSPREAHTVPFSGSSAKGLWPVLKVPHSSLCFPTGDPRLRLPVPHPLGRSSLCLLFLTPLPGVCSSLRAAKNLTPTTSLLAPEFSTSPRFTQSKRRNPDDSQSSPAQFGPHFSL